MFVKKYKISDSFNLRLKYNLLTIELLIEFEVFFCKD